MAVFVIDHFQIIHIRIADDRILVFVGRITQHLLSIDNESSPVEKACQFILLRDLFEFGILLDKSLERELECPLCLVVIFDHEQGS